MVFDGLPSVTAVLGPTNTGKTHYAIERMLAHRTGVIGLPLRLLAREVYDRIVALRGPSVVALLTGEERIVPTRAAYWVCTVEAMPVDLGADFLAVDEIQLCGDADRGHIFTDRLLNARGLHETLLLGSDTMRSRIASLIPGTRFLQRDRFSNLTYTGLRKISRMPPRAAIVGFSAEDVYAIAELIRRQKGGAAVVMGALSPRTRNAQVALYQNGDVDYLVATDAIGMGLNLDITHVAFSGTVKFDGRRHRHLAPSELAQIAGRAGRFTQDGTFGVTGEASPLDPDVIEAIEAHRFEPLRRLQWRNSRLEFGTTAALIASLEAPSGHVDLQRAREADDLATLRALSELPDVRKRMRGGPDVRLLWDVCQVPDFRKVSAAEHASLCARLFDFLHDGGGIPTDWLATQIKRIDRADGDIDALSKRLAYIRTWTYVAQRKAWVDEADHWREETRAVEDRLSDALHARLTQRFVDRRTSVLMRRLKQKEGLVATVTENGEVTIDDQFIGRLEGFRFQLDPSASAEEIKTLRAAGIAALAPALSLRADKFYNAPDTEIDVTEQGGLMWGEHAVGKLVAGADALSPQVQPFVDEDAGPDVTEKVRRRLGHWIDRKIAALFQPLIALRDDETLTGMARGIAFRLVEALGVLPRAEIADDVKALDQDQRAGLRKHGVRFGQYTVFQPLMLKPAPTRLRLVLWSLKAGLEIFPEAPPPGLVTFLAMPGAPSGYYPRAGYRLAGDRAIRIDMLERLADMIRNRDSRAGFEASPEMLSITGLTMEQFASLMRGMGYQANSETRPKRRPAPTPIPEPTPPVAEFTVAPDDVVSTPADDAGALAPEAETEAAAFAPAPDDFVATASDDATATASDDATATVSDDATATVSDEVTSTVSEEGPASVPEEASTPEETAVSELDISPAPEPDDGHLLVLEEIEAQAPTEEAAEAVSTEPVELETFYTFVRAPRARPERAPRPVQRPREPAPANAERQRRGDGPRTPPAETPRTETAEPERPRNRPPGEGPRNKPNKGKPGPKRDRERETPTEAPAAAARNARPPRVEKPIDPDNPFAALMALKLRN